MNNEKENVIPSTNGEVTLLSVSFNENTGMYTVNLAKGSNLAETAFAVTVLLKCLVKDGIVETSDVVLELIKKYLSDPQFDEVKEDGQEN